ncbi:acyl-CoA dehydrogenase [Phyllosticta paracitricarpa]|uniref:Acyl-CoA dehydrogenase n=1 Tax=Phyllosticta paracitricarpa TaxID=2016321 RepID=A0ABR1MUD8_9PEZI
MAPTIPTYPVPFAEPAYLAGLPSPYYSESHLRWQKAVRAFVDEHLLPNAFEWEEAGDVPSHLYETFSKAGMLVPSLPAPLPIEWLKKSGMTQLPGGLKIEEFDYLHAGIWWDELSRVGISGPGGSLTVGMAYGVPPIVKFGSQSLQARFLPDLLSGRKRICIAITEPSAGSDVANISTTAVRSPDGKNFIINGTKKWITNGIWSDYASMAVRTGPEGSGAAGLSMVVVPLKGYKGVTMRRLKLGGQYTAGTTFIELDDVVVPVDNLIGKEGMGMKYIMMNFNHERLSIAISATRYARVALSSAVSYVMAREAFGAPLINQPVVRHRIAKAGAELESLQAWINEFVYQMTHLSRAEADVKLGGLTALAKARAGIVFDECARCAVLLFGGNGYTRTGMGEIAERLYREVPGQRIPGGSEDVMLDLAVRQLVKNYQTEMKKLGKKGGAKL